MPKYLYECNECEFIKEVNHSMSENLTGTSCSECLADSSMIKSLKYFDKFQKTSSGKTSKVGDLVISIINETKQEIHNGSTLERIDIE